MARVELQRSSEGNPVFVEIPILRKWTYYWETQENTNELWQLVADMIINQPYADDSSVRSYVRTFSGTVYRPNHGTVHSIRQLIYIENLFKLVKYHGKANFQHIAENTTLEKIALMELAAFLCRSGRTNEHGHSGDHTYSARSARILELVAKEIKCTTECITKFSGYIADYVPDVNTKLGYTDEDRLFKTLLDLIHHIDLVRCHERSDVHHYLLEKLKILIAGTDKELANWTVAIIALVESVCLRTGTKISSDALSEQTYDKTLFARGTHEVGNTLKELRFLSIGGADSINQLQSAALAHDSTLVIHGSEQWNQVIESPNECLKCHCVVKMGHRHHCRICGKGHFCDYCAPIRKVIIKKHTLSERVCIDCFDAHFVTGSGLSDNRPSYWTAIEQLLNVDEDIRKQWFLLNEEGVQPKELEAGTHFFDIPPNHEIFQKISAYINANIKAQGYQSAKGEDARMNTAEWTVNPENTDTTEFQRTMAKRRLTEKKGLIDPAKSQAVTVRSIRLVINPVVWNKYSHFRERIYKELAGKGGSEVGTISWTNTLANKAGFTLPVLDKSIGEVMLFHGTAAKWIQKIIGGGFDPAVGKNYGTPEKPRYGMLGQGTYFTDSFAKMMTYGGCPLCGDFACNCRSIRTRKKMPRSCILARCTLGKIDHYTSKVLGSKTTKERYRSQALNPDTPTHTVVGHGFHGTNVLTFGAGRNEFMTKYVPQTYPEFVVDYVLGEDDVAPHFHTVIKDALNRYERRLFKSQSQESVNAVRKMREVINTQLDDDAKNEMLSNYVLYYLGIKTKIDDPHAGRPVGQQGALYKHIVEDLQKYGFLPLA